MNDKVSNALRVIENHLIKYSIVVAVAAVAFIVVSLTSEYTHGPPACPAATFPPYTIEAGSSGPFPSVWDGGTGDRALNIGSWVVL